MTSGMFSAPQAGAGGAGGVAQGGAANIDDTLSLKNLLFSQAAQGTASDDTSPDSPKQQLRQFLQQIASAQEANLLQNLQTMLPQDAAAIAWRAASMVQQGHIPYGQVMDLIRNVLKRPGNRKLLGKIKEVLVKKGAISASITAENLEIIAAMIAYYLAKGGDVKADRLLHELFDTSDFDFDIPEGGGGRHQEGRQQQGEEERRQPPEKKENEEAPAS